MDNLDGFKSLCDLEPMFDCNDRTVFKQCGNCIVMLEKLEDTLTNESRSNIIDRRYAKFRANKLLVKKIVDVTTLEELDKVYNFLLGSKFNGKMKYTVGQIVSVDDYDTDLEIVCSTGIHYFLTLERAYRHLCKKSINNGIYVYWFPNGQKFAECSIVDGKFDGKFDGKYEEWYENGQKKIECNYINGKTYGKYEKWYPSGQKCKECNYINNKCHHRYESWHANGKKKRDCNYVYGGKKYINIGFK